MRTNWRVVGLLLACASACQVYDFEPVIPTTVAVGNDTENIAARALKPNVMLLVDTSGSMEDPADERLAGCRDAANVLCGYRTSACPAACPTRMQELKRAMSALLADAPTVARLGLTFYPSDAQCAPAAAIDQQLPPGTLSDDGTDEALAQQSMKIAMRLQTRAPLGGTPTGSSLRFVGDYSELNRDDLRDDFVLLLTDGLPNCNDANRNNICGCYGTGCAQSQLDACKCTDASCQFAVRCSSGCLDRDGVIEAINELRNRKIRTIVVGFGADLTQGDAPAVLNDMAIAGGFARPCTNDTDCGEGACDIANRRCETAFYRARTGDELAVALRAVWDRIPNNLCTRVLAAPPEDGRFISVLLDDENVPPGSDTWTYDAGSQAVLLHGSVCDALKKSSAQRPAKLEIRSARKL